MNEEFFGLDIIYRVEHPEDGLGPYGPRGDEYNHYRLIRGHNGDYDHPSPIVDFKLQKSSFFCEDHFCGFGSLEALKRWFKGHLNYLHRHGFKMVIYRGKIEKISGRTGQVIFIKKDAIKAEERDLI